MTLAITNTFISTVNRSRTITLPDTVPIGAKVAVVLLPTEDVAESRPSREARFATVLAAIRAAIADNFTPPDISDGELAARINCARNSAGKTHRPGTFSLAPGCRHAHRAGHEPTYSCTDPHYRWNHS